MSRFLDMVDEIEAHRIGSAERPESGNTRCEISEISEISPEEVPVGTSGLPCQPCGCGNAHYWRSADGWRCSTCVPMPRPFLGETCTVPGGRPPAPSATTRAMLEAMHPPTMQGIPLAVILNHADPADYDDLRDRALLEAFTAALVASGTIDPARCQSAPEPPTAAPGRALVRCADCAHFQPDELGGGGIGACRAGVRPSDLPLYPGARRFCDEFQPREGTP